MEAWNIHKYLLIFKSFLHLKCLKDITCEGTHLLSITASTYIICQTFHPVWTFRESYCRKKADFGRLPGTPRNGWTTFIIHPNFRSRETTNISHLFELIICQLPRKKMILKTWHKRRYQLSLCPRFDLVCHGVLIIALIITGE